ncbi:MAG: GNAT family N-acetyltransferase [Eubacteriaceae bacterium]|nr:GNAT family N-acetyltransferase [Eubacteriaceae bacterium]
MNCLILPWKADYADDLAAALNNKNITDNLRDGLPSPYTKQDALNYISAMLGAEKDSQYPFAITLEGQAVGSISASRQSNIHSRTAEIGYYVAQPYWGKGICTSAVGQLAEFIFTNTDIIRLFAQPFADNAASCRVLEKCGFICEGILRKNAVKNGVVRDMKMYALLRD